MAHELDIYLFADRVGQLSLFNGRLQFAYAADWLGNPRRSPLSQSLPLQVQAFDDSVCRPFFAGLLPEGRMRQLIAQLHQVSAQNDFALLDRIGGECAGAVSLQSAQQPMPIRRASEDVQWLVQVELGRILDELPSRPMLAGLEGLRLSLAGAQNKLPVVWDGQRMGLPRNGSPSTHILKPAIATVPGSVANEGFCLALAQAMQLPAAKASMHEINGQPFLLVKRYDRGTGTDGQQQRLHQEDFCQALGVVPEMKYQSEGGPDLTQCFTLLRRVTRPSAPQVLNMLDYVVFNALIGNHDAHGKNFSLLYADGAVPVLAPLYDTVATAVYPQLTPKMAMKIGGKYKFSEVQAQHWDAFFQSTGINPSLAKKRLMVMVKRLPTEARKLQADPAQGFASHSVVAQIIELIESRCALTRRRMQEGADDAV
jgi:serine/threonine-protein kinase HipA